MKYRIAIPSYKRHDVIGEKTLKYLKECNIPNDIIDVFVANEEEYEIYKNYVPKELYGNLIVGKETIHRQRNFIRQYYPEYTYLFHLDDDIDELQILKNGELEKVTTELDKIIQFGFYLLKKENTRLGALYPVKNAFFMDYSYHTGLYYCIAGGCWTINDKSKLMDVVLDDKEDFERSIKAFLKYGKVVRLDNVTIKTVYYGTHGGLQETRTPERIRKSGEYLIEKYPHLCEENKARKKHYEIRFKKQKSNKKIRYKK